MLFQEYLVLLAPSEVDLQHALDHFATAYNHTEMKISTKKTEVLCLSRNTGQCSVQVNGVTLNQVEWFKYVGVAFTSVGRQDKKIYARIDKASAVMHELQ